MNFVSNSASTWIILNLILIIAIVAGIVYVVYKYVSYKQEQNALLREISRKIDKFTS